MKTALKTETNTFKFIICLISRKYLELSLKPTNFKVYRVDIGVQSLGMIDVSANDKFVSICTLQHVYNLIFVK